MNRISVLLAMILIPLLCHANTYYVDPVKGDDSNDGKSTAKAWKSLTKVNSLTLAAGDCVEIAPGCHDGSLRPSGSGTAAKPVVIHFMPGTHEIPADKADKLVLFVSNSNDNPTLPRPVGIILQNVKHFLITGGGADVKPALPGQDSGSIIIFDGRMVEFYNDHCENITYSGLTLDLKRPTVSEFRVADVASDSVVIHIAERSTYEIKDGKFSWTGDLGPGGVMAQEAIPETGHCWRRGGWNPFNGAKAEDLGERKVRLTYSQGNMGMQKGRQFQFRNVTRDTVGACNNRCRNVVIRDCNIHALTGMGIVSQFTEDITYERVNTVPPAGTIRTCPAWADVFHFSGCRGKILVDSCNFSGTQDDPINVHGTHLRIIGKPGEDKLLLRFMQPQTYGIEAFIPGDEICVVNHRSLVEKPGTRRKVKMLEKKTDKEWLLTVEGTAPEFDQNDVVDNLTWYPDLTIRNCRVDMDSCRGFLITTRGKVLVEGNTLIRTHMAGILIEDDAEGWFESGPIRDMVIRSNRFIECGQDGSPAISINPHNLTAKPDEPVHENIIIEDNYFQCGGNGIRAKSTKGLTISGNRFTHSSLPVGISVCQGVVMTNNLTSVKAE
jgi:hypothetical protein